MFTSKNETNLETNLEFLVSISLAKCLLNEDDYFDIYLIMQSPLSFMNHSEIEKYFSSLKNKKHLENEIIDSSKKIEYKIGKKPIVFAFANAMGNDESRQYVRNSDYQFSLILMDKLFSWRPIKKHEHTELPRINISRADWREEYLRALGFHVLLKKYFNFF